MSDLVKRLHRAWDGTPGGGALEEEAADHIEALEAEVKRLKALCGRAAHELKYDYPILAAELKEASHE